MKSDDLKTIFDRHAAWLRGDADGARADLSGANLSDAYLRDAYLSGAYLSGANLSGAYLSGAYLRGANLRGANLSGADLSGADLSGANLSDANLRGADLSGADLSGAYLSDAYLRGANLSGANLSGANLSDAYLRGAYLSGLKDETDVTWPAFWIIPETGAFTAWKMARCKRGKVIIQLTIPAKAKRTSSLIGRKCRAEFAKVVAMTCADGAPIGEAYSTHENSFKYRVGETVHPDKYDDDFHVECSNGIHFFITRREAEEYD